VIFVNQKTRFLFFGYTKSSTFFFGSEKLDFKTRGLFSWV